MVLIMEDEMIIDAASPELLEKAIKTLPLIPVYFEVSMEADGISGPGYKEKGGEERYLRECAESNIIPNSQASFVYDPKAGLFVPKLYGNDAIKYYQDPSDYMKDATVQKLLEGGRIHQVGVKVEEIPSPQTFLAFRDTFLPLLLDKGYQLEYGDLWLETWRSRQHASEGYSMDGGLIFRTRGSREGLELRFPSEVSDECRDTVTDWFNNL